MDAMTRITQIEQRLASLKARVKRGEKGRSLRADIEAIGTLLQDIATGPAQMSVTDLQGRLAAAQKRVDRGEGGEAIHVELDAIWRDLEELRAQPAPMSAERRQELLGTTILGQAVLKGGR